MPDPEKMELTGNNPSQSRAAQTLDQAVLGTTPQTAVIRIVAFVVLFIVGFGTLFYFLNS